MSLRQISLVIDTDRNTVRDFAGNSVNPTVVNGDTILLAAHAKRLNYSTGALEDLVLTGAHALRVTVRATRDPDDDLLTFQDTYNSGDLAAFEDLSKGQVTWRLNFNSANLDALFASTDSDSVWLEITYLDSADIPQTLYQGQLTVNQELDDGAVGTPPPSSPTYLTAVEIAAGYQPLDADLTALAGLTSAANKLAYFTGAGAAALADYTASARTFDALTAVRGDLVYASGAATWARLAVGTAGYLLRSDGTDVAWASLATAGIQPLDAELTALAGLTSAADKFPYFTGAGTAALADLTASARTLTALTAVAGDLIYASGAATWARFAVGSANALLRVNAGGTSPEYTLTPSGLTSLSATTLYAGAGAAGTPSIAFAADTDTGIYSVGANNFGFAAAGALVADINTAGINLAAGMVLKVNGTQVIGAQQTALTAQLTTITFSEPGTPDYAIQNLTTTSPYGFVTADEGQTLLKVIANLQTRVSELETKLKAHGLLA